MRPTPLAFAFAAMGALAACGEDPTPAMMMTPTPDGGRPPPRECPPGPNVCACADEGPPDFSRKSDGVASESSDDVQQQALTRTNHWRTAAGLAPLNANAQLEQAAVAHSRFMASNAASCYPGAHNEVSAGCMGFTGASPAARIMAAGYRPSLAGEVINWETTPTRAIDGWIWTVYHRTPFQDPSYTEVGFGSVRTARTNNTMEFARRSGQQGQTLTAPSLFPPPGTEGVPTGFQGNLEGPTPPVPLSTGRWPSGAVVSVMFPSNTFTLTTHKLYDGMCREVVHSAFRAASAPEMEGVQADPSNSNRRFVFLYGDARLQTNTRYTVELRGTVDGAPWSRVWAFTTAP
ncbi:MAG: CAP domain-containing protein [Polyangiales bacterium]